MFPVLFILCTELLQIEISAPQGTAEIFTVSKALKSALFLKAIYAKLTQATNQYLHVT